ncbi:ABC transporter permease [Chryseolinea sp. T2]|uniref:ABC transporter permease n=1 Tax=Chryseolinea sp. T2 TaxID=3129255 RepID=UPI0030768F8D
MIRHYWVTAIRNLARNKRFVTINVIGLSLSIAVFLALTSYVQYHLGFDQFYNDGERIYRIDYFEYQDGQPVLESARTHDRTALLVHSYVPQVEAVTRVYNERAYIFTEDVKIVDQDMLYVDSSFFKVFPVELVSGDADQALVPPKSVVISESAARQYFGDKDPMGKTLYFNERLPFMVTGVFKDIPSTASIDYDFLLSWSTLSFYGWVPRDGTFDSPWTFTYVRLAPAAKDIPAIDNALTRIANEHMHALKLKGHTARHTLRPYEELHFLKPLTGEAKSPVSKVLLYTLVSLSIFVLLAAWMNYINLSLAQSLTRTGEMGVRRAFGASRTIIGGQFFMEAVIVAVVTFTLGATTYWLLTGPYNTLLFDGVVFAQPNLSTWLMYGLGFVLATSLVSFYPCYFITRFKPVAMLRNKLGAGKGHAHILQRTLMVFQLFLAVAVVGVTYVARKQIYFMRELDAGFNTEQTISLRGAASTNSDSLRYVRYSSFRNEVLQHPQFISGASAFNIPGQEIRFHDESLHAVGSENLKKQSFGVMWIDEGFQETFDMKLIGGRNFALRESKQSCIVNETAAIALGFSNPSLAVGNTLIGEGNARYNIVGVWKDYHHESMHKPITPAMFIFRHPFEYGYISFKLASSKGKFMTVLEEIWKKHYPNDTFTCYFMSSFFEDQYASDRLFAKLLGIFGFISVTIASLGLLGMASLSMVKRTKEIGVRKVLGASISNILLMLAKEYVLLLSISSILAFPLIWYATSKWIEGFSYKIELQWWMILVPGLLVMMVSLVAISGQAIRAAMTNPTKVLRDQ